MWLASRLCVKGVITTAQFAAAAELQLSRRPSLGSLVVEQGWMSANQVTAVSLAQADEPDRPFGELAVEMGFLSRDQLAIVVFEQAEQAPTLEDLLIEIGAISAEKLLHEVHEARLLANLCEELCSDEPLGSVQSTAAFA